MQEPGSFYLSLSDAAKKLGTTRDYVNVLVRRGKLKAKKIGRNWATTEKWLMEYLAAKGEAEAPTQEFKIAVSSETIETLEALKSAFAMSMENVDEGAQAKAETEKMFPVNDRRLETKRYYSLRQLDENGVYFLARERTWLPAIFISQIFERYTSLLPRVSSTAAAGLLIAVLSVATIGSATKYLAIESGATRKVSSIFQTAKSQVAGLFSSSSPGEGRMPERQSRGRRGRNPKPPAR